MGGWKQVEKLSDGSLEGPKDYPPVFLDHELDPGAGFQAQMLADLLGNGDLTLAGDGSGGHVPYLL